MSGYLLSLLFLFSFLFCSGIERQDTVQTAQYTKLEEVVVIGRNPISERTSVKKLDKIAIYLNPASNADPLKAITILPASTNVDETANPGLRGGNADRSRIYLNGSPILSPVRFEQANGLGNFSLFNTEIINRQYVYAGNPPLTFGNSSAGIVEIETNHALQENGLQVALTLSNTGIMWNKKISKDNFIQLYSNYQFDKAFLKLNKKSIDNLQSFSTIDFGTNTRIKINDKLVFNTFNYLFGEKHHVINHSLNYTSDAIASKNRFFSVNNVDYTSKKTSIRYATLFDYSRSNFAYGNINARVKSYQYFNAIGVKTKFTRNFSTQYGVESSIYSNQYDDTEPVYYYAIAVNNPTIKNAANVDFHYIEPYLYVDYKVFKNLGGISGAVRKNILWDKRAKSFLSYQISSHYAINRKNRFIISGGRYHSYSTPNYYIRDYKVLSSEQIALDYYYESTRINMYSAVYYKEDKGDFRINNFERYDKINTLGIEFNLDFPFYKRFSINISNCYVDQKQYISEAKYNTALNLKYFIKAQLIYGEPNSFNCSLLFTSRPGNNYTSVHSASFNSNINNYIPGFDLPFTSTFSDYNRFDFTINKLIPLKKSYSIVFASINNIFDKKNQSSAYYNENYSIKSFDFFQGRTAYFGIQFRL